MMDDIGWWAIDNNNMCVLFIYQISSYTTGERTSELLGGWNSTSCRDEFNVKTARVSIMRDELQLYKYLLTMCYNRIEVEEEDDEDAA